MYSTGNIQRSKIELCVQNKSSWSMLGSEIWIGIILKPKIPTWAKQFWKSITRDIDSCSCLNWHLIVFFKTSHCCCGIGKPGEKTTCGVFGNSGMCLSWFNCYLNLLLVSFIDIDIKVFQKIRFHLFESARKPNCIWVVTKNSPKTSKMAINNVEFYKGN